MKTTPACRKKPLSINTLSLIIYDAIDLNTRMNRFRFVLSSCSHHGHQANRLVLDPSNKLPLYKRTGVKAPSPAIQSDEPSNQATPQESAASGGQYCIYQKPKQVTCNVAHMKRVTHQYKYYCGSQAQGKVCTGYRCA